MNILIVDNDESASSFLAAMIAEKGHLSSTAKRGSEAVRIIKNGGAADAVITSLWLQDMNGIELYEQLVKNRAGLAVWVMSANWTDATLIKLKNTGVAGFIPKPLEAGKVGEALDAINSSVRPFQNTQEKAASGSGKTGGPAVKARILVIDDDPGIGAFIKGILEEEGFETAVETGGLPGVDRFRAEPFDIVLIDINMLDLNGIETLNRIKKIRADIFAVMMTGEAGMAEIKASQDAGSYMVLRKPFDGDRLAEQINWLYESKLGLDKKRKKKDELEAMPNFNKALRFAGMRIRNFKWLNMQRTFIIIMLSAVISFFFLSSVYYVQTQVSRKTSYVLDIADQVIGYLQRDEERELKGR